MSLSHLEIRESFLRFFAERGHERIPSSSIIPRNDPTLLFINSGMAPLKNYFTGVELPPATDLCNVQPCLRTTDIADVGDRHHLTLFEMMGSWSIGGYFKARAIELAFELLVDVFKFEEKRLFATVYGGNEALGLEPDMESYNAWQAVGVPTSRLVVLGEDNFWGPAGDTGPCGPCTEVFYDTGADFGPDYVEGGEFDDKSRYIEIWNAGVFMEFEQHADGTFSRLPFRSVDTGSGVERMAMVIQGTTSVYETDVLSPLYSLVDEVLEADGRGVTTIRRVTDHLRSATFAIAEGATPSNEGRGSVTRRLLRKGMALARIDGGAFPYGDFVDLVVDGFKEAYPILGERRAAVHEAIAHEVADFDAVIERGLRRLDQVVSDPPFVLNGAHAFELAATHGLPIELVRDLVADRGGSVDEAGYEEAFKEHQKVSRAGTDQLAVESAHDLAPTEFVGYESLETTSTVEALLDRGEPIEEAAAGAVVEVVVRRTSFYAEGGGQVGDSGVIRTPSGAVEVLTTRRIKGTEVVVHRGRVATGTVRVGETANLAVSAEHRRAVAANHSATHLLQAALRSSLGEHVRQAGSLVEPEYLRFDFLHDAKLSPDQTQAVEGAVNEFVRRNVERITVERPVEEARAMGAIAMDTEKYADIVRVVEFPTVSMEFCGGTHVNRTGDVGLFRITGEESVGKGIRRITAVTGDAALHYTQDREQVLRFLTAAVGVRVDELPARVKELLDRRSQPDAPTNGDLTGVARSTIRDVADGVRLAVVRDAQPTKTLRADARRAATDIDAIVAVVADAGDGATVTIAVPPSLVDRLAANDLLAAALSVVGGRGGGSRDVAQGGTRDRTKVDELLASLEGLLTT